jgi:hypothetical protein
LHLTSATVTGTLLPIAKETLIPTLVNTFRVEVITTDRVAGLLDTHVAFKLGLISFISLAATLKSYRYVTCHSCIALIANIRSPIVFSLPSAISEKTTVVSTVVCTYSKADESGRKGDGSSDMNHCKRRVQTWVLGLRIDMCEC